METGQNGNGKGAQNLDGSSPQLAVDLRVLEFMGLSQIDEAVLGETRLPAAYFNELRGQSRKFLGPIAGGGRETDQEFAAIDQDDKVAILQFGVSLEALVEEYVSRFKFAGPQ
jgi:hypothetical protein